MCTFRRTVKRSTALPAAMLCLLLAPAEAATERAREREARQAELDRACEAARERKLAPLRARFVDECVANGELPSREACETFYADYGAQTGNRAPLFYDLPECAEAHEFRSGRRGP